MKQLFTAEAVELLRELCADQATSDHETMVRLGSAFLAELLSYNRAVPLISRKGDEAKQAVTLFLSSLLGLPFLPRQPVLAVCDVGSGGGFPAIPLAIARPEVSWILIESRQRKCAFLESVTNRVGLDRVRVVCARFESYRLPSVDGVSVITSRAGPNVDSILAWARDFDSVERILLYLPHRRAMETRPDLFRAINKGLTLGNGVHDLSVLMLAKPE